MEKKKKTAGRTAKTTAKKQDAAVKGAAGAPEPVRVKCRVLGQIELGDAVIAAGHPEPVLIEAGAAEVLAKRNLVEVVGV